MRERWSDAGRKIKGDGDTVLYDAIPVTMSFGCRVRTLNQVTVGRDLPIISQ